MNRVEFLAERHNIPLLSATYITKTLSDLIADEIDAYAEYIASDGDQFQMLGGLRKASELIRNYKTESY